MIRTPAPLAIALPATVDEVQAVVRWANVHGVAVVPSGGRTGLSGGAVAANGELVLSLMKRALEMANYNVRATTSPLEALDWIAAAAPRVDVLVTDYRMPALSGLELAQRAGALQPELI